MREGDKAGRARLGLVRTGPGPGEGQAATVEPGEQPRLISELAEEATKYVEDHDLVTVPAAVQGDLAHGDDVAGAAEGEPVLHAAAR